MIGISLACMRRGLSFNVNIREICGCSTPSALARPAWLLPCFFRPRLTHSALSSSIAPISWQTSSPLSLAKFEYLWVASLYDIRIRKHMLCDPAATIIKKLGGLKDVAGAAGVSVTSVQRWRYPRERGGTGGAVPHWHIPALMRFAGESGVDLQPGDFFPASSTSGSKATA